MSVSYTHLQGSDDLARDAFTGNLLCMISSFVFAVYLIVSKKLLEKVGVVTMMKYIFGGAAVSGIIVSSVSYTHLDVYKRQD